MNAKLLAAAVLAAVSTLAAANTPIVAGSGWQLDNLSAANAATDNSAWAFTVATGTARFLVTDCCNVGDTYQLWSGGYGVGLLATSTLYAGAPTGAADTYGFETDWQSGVFGKIDYAVGPGSYTFTISGDGAGGIPASLGVQLLPVPEPSTYAMMLLGLGVAGFVARRRAGADKA